jgi:hypothetical protein
MHNIWLHLGQYLGEALINPFCPVSILKPWIVHKMQGDPCVIRISLLTKTVIRREGSLFTCKNMDLVSISQALTQGLAIDL